MWWCRRYIAAVHNGAFKSLQGPPKQPNKVFGRYAQGPHSTVEMVKKPSTRVDLDANMFRLALTASGLSQAQLAEKCCVGRATISDWHAGRRAQVSRSTLTCVCQALGVPMDRLRGASTGFYPGCGPDDVHPLVGDLLFPNESRL